MNNIFNLHNGEEEKAKVLATVRSNISFSGSNLWILACAIMVASIGLNVNSTAVVIGAMLISPLMGPIVGAGFALGMFDFQLLRKSLKNLLLSTVVGLLVSFLYFFLSPYKESHSEIISRTAPNIYDVLIAFFGGLVGVIAVTRVEKGNPIPGVAIATALMPPLCTAGFGLATGNFAYFGGAMFLYTINCVFICIATYIIVKFLKYPAVEFVDKKKSDKIRIWITVIIALMIIPSIFFAYRFITQQNYEQKVSTFLSREFEDKGNTIVYKKTTYSTNPKQIELAFLTRKFSAAQIKEVNDRLKNYKIEGTQVIIRQDSAFLANATTKNLQTNEVTDQTNAIIAELNNQVKKYSFETQNLFPEAKSILPEITTLSVAKQEVFNTTDSTRIIPVALYEAEKPLTLQQTATLRNWLKVKLKVDTLEIYKR
ncbi:DUF389 domain-containing protein [Kaistella sp. 97-N-M2]|uniref:DUF389 domain-containing protein n=1 Tax=Kaistella sp. 97-N-M2 TaxID=2908645 RepID=UPI001F1E04C6|nr:DUF389 domain-containing protein [Kaistella sp. 97-N-M2]UJF29163.1 DUF389 domain-containing protein [Kaistella sp. 97-N-M2]